MNTREEPTAAAEAPRSEAQEAAERERRRWYDWMPVWLLVPFGLTPGGSGANAGDPSSAAAEDGFEGPHDHPHHLDLGGGGGDMSGGGFGGF